MQGSMSPWGKVESAVTLWEDFEDGRYAHSVTTPSHGGIKLSPLMESGMPDHLKSPRHKGTGWYEEDCEWSLVFLRYPGMDWAQGDTTGERHEAIRKAAHATAKHYYPEAVARYNERAACPI